MSEIEEVQEQMKAMKDQMTTMIKGHDEHEENDGGQHDCSRHYKCHH